MVFRVSELLRKGAERQRLAVFTPDTGVDFAKSFLHAYAAIILRMPLCDRREHSAEIKNQPLCRLHLKTAVPLLIDACILSEGKRRRRTAYKLSSVRQLSVSVVVCIICI